MSKVFVDRELLERVEQWVQEDCTALEELQAVLAQPAEAEGACALAELLALFPLKIDKQAFVLNGRAPFTADGDDEFLSFKKVNAALGEIRRLAEQGHAALSAVTAERDRLGFALQRTEQARAGWEENAELLEKQRDAADKAADACRAECDQLRADRDRMQEEMAELWKRIDNFQSQSHGITALAEIERLRAEAEALRVALLGIASVNPAERGIEWAKAYASDGLSGTGSELYIRWLETFKEAEALRKDAERYRWLRGRLPGSAYRIAGVIYSEGGDGVDAAVDAAMTAKEA